MDKKATIFMTGATGHMGFEGLKLLAENKNLNLKLLVLPDKAGLKLLAPYRTYSNVEIIEGDLRSYNDVLKGVTGADYILHTGALISPMADRNPILTKEINYGGTLNIIKAVQAQENNKDIKLVYIGTVASMGDRLPPIHWCRAGDPLKVSQFDVYAESKVKAERAVIESGLNYWVSLRQTGMLHKDILKNLNPIIYHQPVNTHIEWSSSEDSGQALYNICTMDLPKEFWRNIYNIGGGEGYRETYYQFMDKSFQAMGFSGFRKILSPHFFTLRNFHCCWFSDSDKLEKWLGYRKIPYETFFKKICSTIPFISRLNRFIPSQFIKKIIMKPLAQKKEGPLSWIRGDKKDRINAFWGNRKQWENIPEKWEQFQFIYNPPSHVILHGYDENKTDDQISLSDCKQAAEFRGGKCLSGNMEKGLINKKLQWICGMGHQFSASPTLVLKGGHWCPLCDTDTTNYEKQAAINPFFAQVFRF